MCMLQRCIPHSLQPLQHVHKHNDLEPIKEAAEIFYVNWNNQFQI